jgi:hypothetical protein
MTTAIRNRAIKKALQQAFAGMKVTVEGGRGKCAATAREMLDGENGCGAWRDAATAKAFDARNMALLQD